MGGCSSPRVFGRSLEPERGIVIWGAEESHSVATIGQFSVAVDARSSPSM